jgi:hypothetical protein
MNNPTLPHPKTQAPVSAALNSTKRVEKKSPRKKPRNPLKLLDSDERMAII